MTRDNVDSNETFGSCGMGIILCTVYFVQYSGIIITWRSRSPRYIRSDDQLCSELYELKVHDRLPGRFNWFHRAQSHGPAEYYSNIVALYYCS